MNINIHTGAFGDLWHQSQSRVTEIAFIERLHRRDGSLFSEDPAVQAEAAAYMGWVSAPWDFKARLTELEPFHQMEGDILLVGMGGSSLGSMSLRDAIPLINRNRAFHILDSTHPDTVNSIPLDAPLTFVVASKSGTTAETDAHRRAFADRPNVTPVAITDPGTFLHRLASESGWPFLENPADVGGRFSVLTHFGLAPAALLGYDVPTYLEGGAINHEIQFAAATLGWFLGRVAIEHGINKIVVEADPEFQTVGLWLEQLIAESTGKQGLGILPAAGVSGNWPKPNQKVNSIALYIGELPQRLKTSNDQPLFVITPEDAHDLGFVFYFWMVATAAMGASLGVNPFDQPDVQSAKDATNRQIARLEAGETLDLATETTSEHLINALRDLPEDAYIALLPFLAEKPDTDHHLRLLAETLSEKTARLVTLGYGPRYLHSTGQFHKGGPNQGLHILFTDTPLTNAPIPGKPFTFKDLCAAQALGDEDALRNKDRNTLRFHFPKKTADGLIALREAIQRTV